MLVFVDIDGTIADWSERSRKAGRMPNCKTSKKAFQAWLDRLQPPSSILLDKPIDLVLAVVHSLSGDGHQIVYLTGREEHLRRNTELWLGVYAAAPAGELLMRPESKRWQTPAEFKIPAMHKILSKYVVCAEDVLVIDDDPSDSCSKGYHENGWVHLKVKI